MLWFEAFQTCAVAHKNSAIMHAQHMDIILIFARTRDVGLCRPCLHEKKTDMEQFGKILIVDDNEDVLFALNLLLEPYAEKIKWQ